MNIDGYEIKAWRNGRDSTARFSIDEETNLDWPRAWRYLMARIQQVPKVERMLFTALDEVDGR